MTRFVIFVLLCCLRIVHAEEPLDVRSPKWNWMDEQIDAEFAIFKSGITEEMLDGVMNKTPLLSYGDNYYRLQIINRQVFGRDGQAKELLRKVAEIYPVPDVDVILFDHDIVWNYWELTGPILATCKILNATDKMIHFPVQLWAEWVNFYISNTEKNCANSPWETKIPKAFWRGVPDDADNYNNPEWWICRPRGKLCDLSQQYPELINATFSGAHWWLVNHDLQPEFFKRFPPDYSSWEKYLQHKYLIDLDGHVASNPGYGWKLLSNSVVLKQNSRFTQWFYGPLQPWIHYIPIEHDFEDLFQILDWVKNHDEEARQIAENGRQFAKENMLAEHLYLYCYKVLIKYASLQKFTPCAR